MTESLPSGMPPGISRRLTMTLMELVYESAIQYIASRNPASRLRTKTFPVSQILVKPTPTPPFREDGGACTRSGSALHVPATCV